MAKTILITGIPESGKDEIIDMVLESKELPKFEYIKFDDLIPKKLDFKNIKEFRDEFYVKLERAVKIRSKMGRPIIINGYFTIKTKHGLLPLKIFRPNFLIILESDSDLEDVKTQQDVNRNFANEYFPGLVNIIKVKKGNVRTALKELRGLIKFALG